MSAATIRAAIDALTEATSTPLDRNDLGRLARMHSHAQEVAQADQVLDEPGRQALRALGGGLVTLLEKLILAEAADPDGALALVPEIVDRLRRAIAGERATGADITARIESVVAGVTGSAAASPSPLAFSLPAAAPEPPSAAVAPGPSHPELAKSALPEREPDAAPSCADVAAEEPYVSEPLTVDLSERDHLQGFIEESREHMDAIEAALLAVEKEPSDTARINELFRPFHTIKGIAGFLNLRDINRLTHELETILDLGRKNELQITSATIDRIFAAVDLLKAQIAEIQRFLANPSGTVCPQPNITAMMAELRRIARGGGSSPGVAPPAATPRPRLGEILISSDAATPGEVDEALDIQSAEAPSPRPIGQILVERGAVSHKQVESALTQQATEKVVDQTLRVETVKLDGLVDAVGELVIAQTMVSLSEAVRADPQLLRTVGHVTKIVRDIQQTAMGLRMVPIGPTFQKMRRLVRDVARKAGKNVELHINGEDTELDKTVIQQMSDPLVHMVRNAVDHGIEPPQERVAQGKPETGNVYLDAYHKGDAIVIEVCDDGRGLEPKKLIAKGIERGLVQPDEQLTDQQAYALIMAPGFSTAEKITDISGRGVGMDVVRRNIEQLRGKIEIQSEVGQGSTFLVRLPLTLAIIDGMLVRVGRERMIIPTILIEQSLRPQRAHVTTVQQRGEMLLVRGELCPLVQLGELFEYTGRIDPCEALVVIAHCDGQKIGLVVDELIGQQQVVIKSLGESLKRVQGVSGAAILGDGRVGLILEPSGLLRLHSTHHGAIRGRASTALATPDSARPGPSPEVRVGAAATAAPAPEIATVA